MFIRYTFVLAVLFLALPPAFAQLKLKSPDEFLPHRLGEQFTPHHLLTDYYEYLAANAPATVKLERYGYTNEARPLQIACFSSPENIARLEQIRTNNLRLSGTTDDPQKGDKSKMPAIVWLNMSVHGNEPSGSECGMLLAWQLATQSEADVKEWLKNTVVIIDPSSNPDGYDRYSSWYRGASNLLKNPSRYTREHQEPWPGGRPNHYFYDLNRDWAWATQVETRQRLNIYHRWLPHIVADVHEQHVDDPYYFAPAAEPMHAYLTPFQRDFQAEIGANHARYFDQNGWLYFTNEVFDLLYPSYGDTYPMFNGAIGMTYEQAGNGRAGRAIKITNGDTLTLHDRILHQITTSRSTIEIASKHYQKIVDNFADYYARALSHPPGEYGTFVIRATNDPNRVNTLCQLLDRHQIHYGRAGTTLSNVKGFDYVLGKEITSAIQPNDLVISAFQPKAVMVQTLFEPNVFLSDSLTYDITAWALPFAHGLDAFAARQRIDPKKPYTPWVAVEINAPPAPYAWCVHRRSMADQAWVAALLDQGIKIRYATESFHATDQQFEPGTFVINRADNRSIETDLDRIVKETAKKYNVALHPVFTGLVGKGPEMGSSKFHLVTTPSVGLVYNEDSDENALGHTWYFFEQELGYPVNIMRSDKLSAAALQDINTLIFPNDPSSLDDKTMNLLKEWVSEGGRIIAFEGGIKAFADKSGFDILAKPEAPSDSASKKVIPYHLQERHQISEQLPGAIVKAQVDTTHPLAYGLGPVYYSLKTNAAAYQLNSKLSCAVWLDDEYDSYGFIGYKVKPRLKNSPIAGTQQIGNGTVVYLTDSPVFRSFWQNGKMILANALFF